MQDLTCVFEGIDGRGAIFISAVNTAKNIALLKKHNIKAVLSIARGTYIDFVKEDISHYLYLPADDIQSYNLSQHFQGAFNFIEQARRETNLLIHCVAGISRSATITAAYLMKKYDCSLEKVLLHLKRKRSKIDPNPGFLQQLKQLEKQILMSKKQRSLQKSKTIKPTKQHKQSTIIVNQSYLKTYTSPASPYTSPSKQQTSPLVVLKNVGKSKRSQSNVKNQMTLKRRQSLNCKIDKLKQSLILKGKMVRLDENASACFSPSKVYSPSIYRKREKLDFSKY